ncbi:hypothetical protein ACFY7C_19275 [Streptomyces sp. NPDC012769]|uniref:hypothetical protein n=1 Tax=Streptomyces sp. NPDC012769 TaxID=3364848 RepID=UPI0036B1C224
MMPHQRDYGDAGDATLVPGALTAYRHFFMYSDGGPRLLPMAIHCGAGAGVYTKSESTRGKAEVFQAQCYSYATIWGTRGAHDTPSLDCTCGFYAHYFPETDFYDDEYWDAFQDGEGLLDHAIVRAVVEVSGRVVVGALGVRAEKIKIKALAIDWEKCRREITFADLDGEADLMPVPARRVIRAPNPRVRQAYENTAAEVAGIYGATYYSDAAQMYADHPQQDLKQLGINAKTQREVEEERARKRQEDAQRILADVQAATDAFQRYATAGLKVTLNGAPLDGVTSVTWDNTPIAVTGAPPANPLVRAIEAKKNRPAPPGTGIDRRRRKL